MARRKIVYVADGKNAATEKEFADFLEAHGGKREAVTDASIDMGSFRSRAISLIVLP